MAPSPRLRALPPLRRRSCAAGRLASLLVLALAARAGAQITLNHLNPPSAVSSTPTTFSIATTNNAAVCVGISSTSDWDVSIGAASSVLGGPACDFLIADGLQGTIAPL